MKEIKPLDKTILDILDEIIKCKEDIRFLCDNLIKLNLRIAVLEKKRNE